MRAMASYDGDTSESFDVSNGVKQGCVLASSLFALYLTTILEVAFKDSDNKHLCPIKT